MPGVEVTGTLLVTVTGRDRPGLTSRLFAALASLGVEVLDIEQVVLRGRLVLGVLVTAPSDPDAARRDLGALATELGLELELETGAGDTPPRARGRSHVTVLGAPLLPGAFSGIAERVTACGANIDRIVRMARYPVTAVELDVSGADPDDLRRSLTVASAALGVDVAVSSAGLQRRAKRLVVMDVDSTLVQGEVIEMLARRAGVGDQVVGITTAAMNGELDFEQSLRSRVALLAGLPSTVLDEVRDAVVLTPGARTLVRTLKRLDHRLAIVSGGFSHVTDALGERLGVDYSAANTLEVVGGRLTGRVVGPVVDRAGKAAALERFAADAGVPLAQVVAVGDGANDLDMLARAGLGIAFNARPLVRSAADAALNVPYLDAILYLLGITREEVEAADAADAGLSPAVR